MTRSPTPTWQVDFYRCPLVDGSGHRLWALVACSSDSQFEKVAFCPQPLADSEWIADRLQQWFVGAIPPATLHVFRPQCLASIQQAGQKLGIPVIPTRRTAALKQRLQVQARLYPQLEGYLNEPYDPFAIDPPPPATIPEEFQGERWQFAALSRLDFIALAERSIPIKDCSLLAGLIGVSPDLSIPGAIFYGDRRSLSLVQWLQTVEPVSLNFVSGDPHGVILEAGLSDRWVMATFTDLTVVEAAAKFERRKSATHGFHFLMVMPDDSGTTVTGLWLLGEQQQNN